MGRIGQALHRIIATRREAEITYATGKIVKGRARLRAVAPLLCSEHDGLKVDQAPRSGRRWRQNLRIFVPTTDANQG